MCGIAGLSDLNGLGGVRPMMARALERLAPRGPDGEGVWSDARTILGHRRLAVIDLSPDAAQPMVRGDLAVTFNGEIYNFQAIRSELAALGETFSTRSDTEALLVGWRRWGKGLLPRLDGMFAFAIWDQAARTLTIARDRFGKKPLLYRHQGGRFAFASDLVALGRLWGGENALDRQALRHLFALRFIPVPWTILEGVHKLPPGHMGTFKGDGFEVERWYDPTRTRPTAYTDETVAARDLRDRFDRAVIERLVSDVPVGMFLSGGIDSAVVAAALAAQGRKVRSFTVGFPGAAEYYEERPAARRVADHLGIEHTEIEIAATDARAAIAAVFAAADEPFADSSALPQYLLCRATRAHVTVALSGDGADEVFGGYRKYQGELWAETYRRMPGPLRRGLIEPLSRRLPEGKGNRLLETFRRARRFAAEAGKTPPERQAGWMRLLAEDELDRLLGPLDRAVTVEDLVIAARAQGHMADPVNAMLAADVALGLEGDMLVKVDRMSMGCGLEVRSPFLDHNVVECAMAMPGPMKLTRSEGKRILRLAFADRLPAEVFTRPKKGFEMPIADWLRGDLRDLARNAVDPDRLKAQGLFDPMTPKGWLDELVAGTRDTSWRLWTLIAFQAWADTHGREVNATWG